MPTSREINEAIETLRYAGPAAAIIGSLDVWNAKRLRTAAGGIKSQEDFAELFAGISDEVLAEAGIV